MSFDGPLSFKTFPFSIQNYIKHKSLPLPAVIPQFDVYYYGASSCIAACCMNTTSTTNDEANQESAHCKRDRSMRRCVLLNDTESELSQLS